MNMPSSHLATDTQQGAAALSSWTATLSSSLRTLHRLAGTTEREFLQIGSQMQVIYYHSAQLSSTAQLLAEIASGARLDQLIDQLRQILAEMENYLGQTQNQSNDSSTTLATVNGLLIQVGELLEGFCRMSKQLYLLEVLIKIESSCLGDMGGEFINLALDLKKLSQQVKIKVVAIHHHCLSLTTTIDHNIGIVQSMQFHDIFRQQVEHVIVDGVSGHIKTITSLPTKCAATNSEIITTVKDVGSTVAQITAYVADIEEIGHEIIQIALNARIKASATGTEGDSLSVLAEEIRAGLAEAARVIIDFDHDLTLDVTTLQLFCSACAQATAEGKVIIHRGASPAALLELAEAAGTERHMRCRNANRTCFRQVGGEATWQS